MTRPDIFVIAGESSGDLHSSQLIRDVQSFNNNLNIIGIGGIRLQEQGVKILFDYFKINYIGFVNVAKNYFYLKNKINKTAEKILELSPKVVILCDFPGFNLRIAQKIRAKYTGKIIYYITPQVWAWHKNRVHQLKKYTDACFSILPFEKTILLNEGINAFYAGNPVLKQCEDFLSNKTRVERNNKVISIMPGSRKEEIDMILPLMIDIGNRLSTKYNYEIKLIGSENISINYYNRFLKNSRIKLVHFDKQSNLKAIYNSDLVITKFGTSNLECAFLNIPFTAVYKANFLNYMIAKSLVKLKYLSLVNIIMDKEIIKEFIQSDFTSDKVIEEVENIFTDISYKNKMLTNFGKLKSIFDKDINDPAKYICKYL